MTDTVELVRTSMALLLEAGTGSCPSSGRPRFLRQSVCQGRVVSQRLTEMALFREVMAAASCSQAAYAVATVAEAVTGLCGCVNRVGQSAQGAGFLACPS